MEKLINKQQINIPFATLIFSMPITEFFCTLHNCNKDNSECYQLQDDHVVFLG
jgi:hypothetical protein